MKASEPSISIVMGTYNRGHLVGRAIDQVLAQTMEDLELLVVDDGSTDDTETVVATRRDSRLRYVRRPNGGISLARNSGAQLATGRYLVFLDDDDEPCRHWLEALLAAADTPGTAIASCGAEWIVDDDPKRVIRTQLPRPLGPAYLVGSADEVRALFLAGTFAVRRQLFADVGGFAPGLASSHSTELAYRLVPAALEAGERIVAVDDVLIRIRAYERDRRQRSPRKLHAGAAYLLDTHRQQLALDPRSAARYASIAGVAALSMGDVDEGRRRIREALSHRPYDWRNRLRLLATYVAPLRRWRWGVGSDAVGAET